jgi:hypothetical protein
VIIQLVSTLMAFYMPLVITVLQERMAIMPLWLSHTTSGFRYGLVS